MHVVARKALRLFWQKHPDAKPSLSRWFKVMSKTDFGNFSALRAAFPNADKVGDLVGALTDSNPMRAPSAHRDRPAYRRPFLPSDSPLSSAPRRPSGVPLRGWRAKRRLFLCHRTSCREPEVRIVSRQVRLRTSGSKRH